MYLYIHEKLCQNKKHLLKRQKKLMNNNCKKLWFLFYLDFNYC